MGGVLVIARSHTHEDATLTNSLVVSFDTLFRHVPAYQGADHATRGRTGDGRRKRACNDETQARQGDGCAHSRYSRSDGAERSTYRAADTLSFSRFVAEFGLLGACGRKALSVNYFYNFGRSLPDRFLT